MTQTRIAVLVVFASAIAGGCKKPSARAKPTGSDATTEAVTLSVPGAATPQTPTGRDGRGAEAFAGQFLKAVNDGTATPAMLTPQFKKVIAEPMFESDKAVGYSEVGAESWLARLKGKLPGVRPTAEVIGTGGEALGYAGGFGGPGQWTAYALRVASAGGVYQADWLGVAPVEGWHNAFTPGGPAGFPAAAFLQSVVAGDDRLAAGLMSSAMKARMAPPFESDKALGFNRGLLAGKLADLRGTAKRYKLSVVNGAEATAELIADTGPKPLALKFVKGERPWDWLVDDIQTK
jgi:hypothetical protein